MIQVTFYTGRPSIVGRTISQALDRWESKLGNCFGGFTKLDAKGYWEGAAEYSLVYVVVFSEAGIPQWEHRARYFKVLLADTLEQQEVLVTWQQLGGLI